MSSNSNNFDNNDINDSNNEINENTVEYKVVNQYSRNNNILNKIYYENNEDYKILITFMKRYLVPKDSQNIVPNITCPGKRYYINDNGINNFFNLLKNCSKTTILHFRELQHSNYEKKEGSGIMFDFDLLQISDKNELSSKNFKPFIASMFSVIAKVIDIDENEDIYSAITIKNGLVYKEDKKLYKNGFHILIPSIQLSKQAKKILFNELLNDKDFNTIFEEMFENRLLDAFDTGSTSVPVYFMYNCKENSVDPYKFYKMYNMIYKNNNFIEGGFSETEFMASYNIIHELSLNFEGSFIKKKYYDLKETYNNKLKEILDKVSYYDNERDEAISTFNTFNSYVDDNLDYYKKIVLDILDIRRAEDRNLWRNVIFAISNINPGLRSAFKPIAKLFSLRAENKYDSNEFEKMWDTAISDTSNSESKLTMKSLIYWCIEDNETKFKRILSKDILNTIELDVYSRDNRILNGTLYQFHFAYYIYHLFKQKFIYDVDSTGKNGQWFEFVLHNDSHDKGQIYKWRVEHRPDNLILYMSNKLPLIISTVIKKAEDRIKNNPDDEEINEYIKSRTNNLKKSSQSLYKTEFKNGVIKEAECFFRNRSFIKRLDTSQNILGVGNGVLELSTQPRLLTSYHDYPVSLYTETNYEPYNPNNKHTKKLISVLLDLFPEDELDAFHYIMYYLAVCLDGRPKDSIILILTGSGCHGINTPILMYDNSIKLVQDIKIGDLIMGDDGDSRTVKELYRGMDQMINIIPENNKDFIVNINHVLSLKFKDLFHYNITNNGDYVLYWYEYDGINEPIMKYKYFINVGEMFMFNFDIMNNKNVIQKNDIIDIKIIDLIKWNKKWIDNGNILLYKGINDDLIKFKLEFLNNDNYYGFELDKNHRYMTGDNIVHHNSNGKSFFTELVKCVMGRYGAKMNMSFLTESRARSSGADEQLMSLKTARLAYYSETNKNEVLNTAKLKELTSQETLSGRGIYEKQTNFRPTCSHMVTTNYQFSIKTTDHGIWRRIVTYSFKMTFVEGEPDPNNKYEKRADPNIAKELSFNEEIKKSFLSILVEYYKDLYINHGGMLKNIQKPSIDKETIEYRNKEDVLNRFIDEMFIYSKDAKVCLSDVVEKYELWYDTNIGRVGKPEKNEIYQQINNSKLVKYIKKDTSKVYLADLRMVDESLEEIGDVIDSNECFLKDMTSKRYEMNNNISYNLSKFNPLNL